MNLHTNKMDNKIIKVSACTPVPEFNAVRGLIKVEVGDEVWVKGIIRKIDNDGYVHFVDDCNPINGCLFRKTYSETEIILNKKQS